MTADSEARQIAIEILDDFRKMFPGSRLLPAERTYLAALIVAHVREALAEQEDDHR